MSSDPARMHIDRSSETTRPIVGFGIRSYHAAPYLASIRSNTERWISTHAAPVPAQRVTVSRG